MGGGVMRTAAKAAKAASSAAHAPWIDHAAAAAGRSVRPQPAAVSVAGQTAEGLMSFSAAVGDNAVATGKKGPWVVDDWEFAGGLEEELSEALRPAPVRLVFGPVPTLEEAREATADLKNALEEAYSSPAATFNSSADHPNSDSETRLVGILPSCPTHVVQAFSFLQASPQAQEVVASLASDKNIWDAVMKNEMVMEFYNTRRINSSLEEPKNEAEATDDSFEPLKRDKNPNEASTIEEQVPANGLKGFVDFIKVKLEEMANKLSGFVKDLMGEAGAPDTSPNTTTATKVPDGAGAGSAAAAAAAETALGASFIALAIATILTILFKRG